MTTALSRARKRIAELAVDDDFDPGTTHLFLAVLAILDEEQEAEQERPLDVELERLIETLREMALAYHTFNGRCTTDIPSCRSSLCVNARNVLALAKPLIPDEPKYVLDVEPDPNVEIDVTTFVPPRALIHDEPVEP